MMKLRATPTHHHMWQRCFMSNNLSRCTHVFLRQDAVRRTLEQPCHCPHRVMKRGTKTFTVDVNGKQEVISLDGLTQVHIKDSVMIGVTATDNTLLRSPPAIPTS